MAMQTHSLHVVDGRARVLEIQTELFAFSDVLDVFVTGRPDVIVVACAGRPRPAEWLSALRAAGFEIPGRRHARPVLANLLSHVVDYDHETSAPTRAVASSLDRTHEPLHR